MTRRSRIHGLLAVLLVVVTVQVVTHLFRWYAHRDERGHLIVLREQLVDAGAELVRAQLAVERLETEIKVEDRQLENHRRAVEAYDRHAREGALPGHLYDAYRRELNDFNTRVQQRNAWLEEWNAGRARRDAARVRYTTLADSMQAVAARAREPFYPIPLPAEAAAERGVGARNRK